MASGAASYWFALVGLHSCMAWCLLRTCRKSLDPQIEAVNYKFASLFCWFSLYQIVVIQLPCQRLVCHGTKSSSCSFHLNFLRVDLITPIPVH